MSPVAGLEVDHVSNVPLTPVALRCLAEILGR